MFEILSQGLGELIYNTNHAQLYKQLIGLVGRVFANGPGDLGSIPGSCHTKDF